MCFVKSHFSRLWHSVAGAILLVQRSYLRSTTSIPWIRRRENRWTVAQMQTELWMHEIGYILKFQLGLVGKSPESGVVPPVQLAPKPQMPVYPATNPVPIPVMGSAFGSAWLRPQQLWKKMKSERDRSLPCSARSFCISVFRMQLRTSWVDILTIAEPIS